MQIKKRKVLIALGILGFAAIITVGCRKQKKTVQEEERNLPKIVIGCDDYSPFSYTDVNGETTGIDVELAKEAFGRMGYQPEFSFINWEDKKELLKEGTIDCIWSSFSMDGREEDYKWAGPYMQSHQVVAVNKDSKIRKLEDLKGKVIAVQSTTKPEEIFRNHEGVVSDFGKIISVQNRDLIYTFLSKGYVDAIAAHDTSIDQFMADFDMEYQILDEPLLTVGLGVAFDSEDERGIDKKLSKTLKKMRKDGTIEQIVGKYLKDTSRYLGEENGK